MEGSIFGSKRGPVIYQIYFIVERTQTVAGKRKIDNITKDNKRKAKLSSNMPEDRCFQSLKDALEFLRNFKAKSKVVEKLNVLISKASRETDVIQVHLPEFNVEFDVVIEDLKDLELLASEPKACVLFLVEYCGCYIEIFYLYYMENETLVELPRIGGDYDALTKWKGCLKWESGLNASAVLCANVYNSSTRILRFLVFRIALGETDWTCQWLRYSAKRGEIAGPLIFNNCIYWLGSDGNLECLGNDVHWIQPIPNLISNKKITSIASCDGSVYVFQDQGGDILGPQCLTVIDHNMNCSTSPAPPNVKLLLPGMAGGHPRFGPRGEILLSSSEMEYHLVYYDRRDGHWSRRPTFPCPFDDECDCDFAWIFL